MHSLGAVRAMLQRLLNDACDVDTQEGVDALFKVYAGGQGRGLLLASLLTPCEVLRDIVIVRLHRLRESQIGQSVFVPAAQPGGRRQGRQALQGGPHLGGGAFKQAATSRREKCVATKNKWSHWGHAAELTEVSHMAAGVARNIEHCPGLAEHMQLIAVTDRYEGEVNAFTCWPPHRPLQHRTQAGQACGVIVVVVGH